MMDELPVAYAVVKGHDGRFYPMRFGRWRLDARGDRISYGRRDDAVRYCWAEQRDYERRFPAPGDRPAGA